MHAKYCSFLECYDYHRWSHFRFVMAVLTSPCCCLVRDCQGCCLLTRPELLNRRGISCPALNICQFNLSNSYCHRSLHRYKSTNIYCPGHRHRYIFYPDLIFGYAKRLKPLEYSDLNFDFLLKGSSVQKETCVTVL